MINRRHFLKSGLCTAGAMSLMPGLRAAPNGSKPPMRFIFLHMGNGLFPSALALPSFNSSLKAKDEKKEAFEEDLSKHDLPDWMEGISAHKDSIGILQGISGRICTTGHHSFASALGAFKGTEKLSSLKWASVDFELAKLFPSPLGRAEFACFPSKGGDPRGDVNAIGKGYGAVGAQKPSLAYGSPRVAIKDIFKSVSNTKETRTAYNLEKKLLEFRTAREEAKIKDLTKIEELKIKNYLDSIKSIKTRNINIDAMGDKLLKVIPKLDKKYLQDEMFVTDRQMGHTEVLLSTLTSGLTNVVAFNLEENGMDFTGLPGLENERVGIHGVGHGHEYGGVPALEIRRLIRLQHMKLLDKIVKKLKATPEADGTMFDNTTILYYSNSGETHHASGVEFPFLMLAGKNTKINIAGRYIRLPYVGQEGCKTMGNLWTSFLNAYGNPIEHYGELDPGLLFDQKGAIKQLMV